MQKLNETYLKMKQVLGEHMEPLESVQLVETYRRYLKPEKVRVLLLAESHVFTSDEDRQIIIPPHTDLPDYPTQYARFVYCLGYGEQILTQNQLYPKNTGTPLFWKIFFSCNNPISSLKDFSTILGQTSQQKVSNKIKLLKDLKEKGIWLVDTSIVALYKEGAKDPNMSTALEISWQSYTREVVLSAKPEHVICIGKGVAKIVENDLKKHFLNRYTVIPQPTRLTPEQNKANYEKYSTICFHSIFENPSGPLQSGTGRTSDSIQRAPSHKTKDTSKYNFEGCKFGKGPLVLAVIKKYVAMNLFLDFKRLLEAFPKKLQGSHGVFDIEEKAKDKRHFTKLPDLIRLADCTIAVSSQWGSGNIGNFLNRAKKLGYQIDDSQ